MSVSRWPLHGSRRAASRPESSSCSSVRRDVAGPSLKNFTQSSLRGKNQRAQKYSLSLSLPLPLSFPLSLSPSLTRGLGMCGHWHLSPTSRRRNVHPVAPLYRLRGRRGDYLRGGVSVEELRVCQRGSRRGPGGQTARGAPQ